MREVDLERVVTIEQRSFASPWKKEHFLHELRNNVWAVNLVAEREGEVAGYACVWCVHDELKINNIAIHEKLRRRGFGRWLLLSVLREALARGCRVATLEVRPSNAGARNLYRSHGFVEVGRYPNYYSDEGEDAIVMSIDLDARRWTEIASGGVTGV
jgi:ribosomal-protein-alanine N-acetyltransferase